MTSSGSTLLHSYKSFRSFSLLRFKRRICSEIGLCGTPGVMEVSFKRSLPWMLDQSSAHPAWCENAGYPHSLMCLMRLWCHAFTSRGLTARFHLIYLMSDQGIC